MQTKLAEHFVELAERLHREETDAAGMLTIPYSWLRDDRTGTLIIVVPWADKADKALEVMKREFPR